MSQFLVGVDKGRMNSNHRCITRNKPNANLDETICPGHPDILKPLARQKAFNLIRAHHNIISFDQHFRDVASIHWAPKYSLHKKQKQRIRKAKVPYRNVVSARSQSQAN